MDEKIKMYTTLMATGVVTTALVSGIYMSDFNSNMVGSSDTSAAKNAMSEEQLNAFLSGAETDTGSDTALNAVEEVEKEIDQDTLTYAQSLKQEFNQSDSQQQVVENISSIDSGELPNEVNLEVTFFPQAPDADWSLPWKEACEESSIIQAYYYVQDKYLSKDTFRSEILSLVETQNDILGKYVDTSMSETAQFLRTQYGYSDYEIIDNPTIDNIKKELAQGHPIIAPFAGKLLGNIYFSDGGPRYHVLVIVGYDESGFITNDVGTSRGENFPYSYNTIMNAMHDLVPLGEGDILDGEKRILVMR